MPPQKTSQGLSAEVMHRDQDQQQGQRANAGRVMQWVAWHDTIVADSGQGADFVCERDTRWIYCFGLLFAAWLGQIRGRRRGAEPSRLMPRLLSSALALPPSYSIGLTMLIARKRTSKNGLSLRSVFLPRKISRPQGQFRLGLRGRRHSCTVTRVDHIRGISARVAPSDCTRILRIALAASDARAVSSRAFS